jgi:hypothetical protein
MCQWNVPCPSSSQPTWFQVVPKVTRMTKSVHIGRLQELRPINAMARKEVQIYPANGTQGFSLLEALIKMD